jgi:outer membrane immunogenic protein
MLQFKSEERVMRRSVGGCVGLLALQLMVGAAAAADVIPRYQPVPPAPAYGVAVLAPPYWTGFYLGINGGGGWGRSQWDGVDTFAVSGGLIGGTIGYNWQLGPRWGWVLGVEGDVDWSGIGGTTTVLCPLGCQTRNHWLATARGRVGFAWDWVLPYVTAGLAAGDISAATVALPGGSTTATGWTAGAGVEFGVWRHVSVKAEYLFETLSSFNCGFNCGLAAGGNVSFYANVFRGGLNVRF